MDPILCNMIDCDGEYLVRQVTTLIGNTLRRTSYGSLVPGHRDAIVLPGKIDTIRTASRGRLGNEVTRCRVANCWSILSDVHTFVRKLIVGRVRPRTEFEANQL
jgi:hypothetical protein